MRRGDPRLSGPGTPLQEPQHLSRVNEVLLQYPDCGRVLVAAGREVVVEPEVDSPAGLVMAVIGPALGVLLHQRGLLVLHGSAVEVPGGAAIFLGESGAGKSTLAAALIAAGHALVSDDVVAVDCTVSPPQVTGGYPLQKIWPDAGRILALEPAVLDRLDPAHEKRALHVQHFKPGPVVVAYLYLLEPGPAAALESIAAGQAYVELVRQTYVSALLPTGDGERHLRQLEALTRAVPMRRLLRPDGPLDTTIALIRADWNSPGRGTGC